jgi:hypothetical protein
MIRYGPVLPLVPSPYSRIGWKFQGLWVRYIRARDDELIGGVGWLWSSFRHCRGFPSCRPVPRGLLHHWFRQSCCGVAVDRIPRRSRNAVERELAETLVGQGSIVLVAHQIESRHV